MKIIFRKIHTNTHTETKRGESKILIMINGLFYPISKNAAI